MQKNIDNTDVKILNVLKTNSKLSTQKISKETGIPITTVHHRIKKMEKNQVIKGYSVNIDSEKLDLNITAYILIKVDYGEFKRKRLTQDNLAKKIASRVHVEETAIVTGDNDIITKVRVKNMAALNKFVIDDIRNLEGIRNTQTLVVMEEL